jgi:hypothetical protein
MVYSGLLRRVALVRTDVSEELTRATRRNNPEDTILHTVVFLLSVLQLLVTANIVPSLPILVTQIMETKNSSEMWVLTSGVNIPEGGIPDTAIFVV